VTAEFWLTQAFNGISYGALLLLLASGLSLIFGVMHIVNLAHGSSLTVRPGERRALIGPNGPARPRFSTSCRGRCRSRPGAWSRTKFSMLRPLGRYPALAERARATLAAVGLADRAAAVVRHLSHGEQRQLEIALVLAGAPRLLLLDEPTAGLSPAESHAMTALLKNLDPAITLLVIEHDMDVAFALTDRITVLHYGKVVADGLAHEVKASSLVQEIYLGAP